MVVGYGTEQHSIAYLCVMSSIILLSCITNINLIRFVDDIIKYNIIPTTVIQAFFFFIYMIPIIMFGFSVVGK